MITARRKAMIFLFLAFILAAFTAWFIINQVSEAQEVLGQSVKVAVAKKDVPAYSEITSEMIGWTELPKSGELSSLIVDEKELEGNVSIAPLKKGDLYTSNLIRPRVDIPSDHRIVWLNPSDNVILDQDIAVGDDIDIIASFKDDNDTETKRILEDIPVVQSEERGTGDEDQTTAGPALKVSLSIPQAELLIHMQNTAQQVRVLRVTQVPLDEGRDEDSQANDEDEQQEKQEAQSENSEQDQEEEDREKPSKDEKEDDEKKESKDEGKKGKSEKDKKEDKEENE